ncbi:MAG: DNA cytosine methyltransferase [Acidobacteriota bacterium]|nr:DNA cytosine methyltransferase [Acidobacteriota bacterium]
MITVTDIFAGAGGSTTGMAQVDGVIVDLFAGPGGWDEGLRMIGRTDVVGVEWDESACRTAEAAGHRRLRADVAALNPRDYIGAEGLIASPPCFVAGTPVVTERAVLPIEEVRVGDRVLTHAGRWCRVESTGSKVAETVTVKGQGTSGITCTPDHRFYTRTYRTWVSGRTRARVEEWGDPTWTPATELGGSRWAIPATAAPVAWSAPIDPWLVGRWLADGWCNLGRGEVLWAIGDEKLDEFKARCNLPVAYAAMDGCHRVTLCGARDLATWLAANFGSGAHRKTIPGVVLGASETARRALLDGYLSGDSHRVDDHARKAVTVSACLATGVRLLAAGLGLAVSVTVNRPSATKTMPDGRVVNQRPWYAVTLRDQRARRFLHLRDGHWWGRVRSIEPSPPQRVYDIQVADDHSYVADGIVVHNCQAWSLAGRRGGEEDRAACHELADRMAAGDDSTGWRDWTDDRSPLVCQPVRWVRELRPEWIALEEVPSVLGLWEHMARIFRAWGYHVWVGVLNAADYGVPQTRKRAILLASRTRKVHRPTPTHSRVPSMFTAGWVSMADALGWGFDSEPSCTVSSGGAATGGAEPFANAGYRKRLASFVSAGVTGEGRPKDVQTQPADTITGKGTAYFLDRPAPTIVGTRRSKDGMIVGRQLPPGEGENVGGGGWADRPAPTPAWVEKRPSTTVAADPRIADPGYRKGKERQFRPDGIRVTVQEAGILQSFPADYPWQGTRTKQYEQVGNAVPPLLAAHVLAALGVGTLEAAA